MDGFSRLKLLTPAPITLLFSPSKIPSPKRWPALNNPLNPLHARQRDDYAKIPEDVLYWKIVTETSLSALPKAVVRERVRRRWREAFSAALKQRGYDRHGRLLVAGVGASTEKPLQGTMELLVMEGYGLNHDFRKLLAHADEVVVAIRKAMERQLFRSGF